MATSNTDSQGTIFWERLRTLVTPSSDRQSTDDDPRRGLTITVCVLISSVIWLTLSLQEPKTVTLDVPTTVVNVPDGQALAQLPPSTVRVQVHGEGLQLLWLYLDRPAVPIDATSNEVNVQDALDLSRASDVRVESVSPQRVDVRKERRIERRIPIRSRVRVDVPPAHELLFPPRLEPDSVTVTGATSVVTSLTRWPTDTLRVEVADSVRTDVPLADTLTHLVVRGIESVTLQARAGKFAEAQREIDVEVTGIPSDQNLVALDPSTIRVRYRVLFDQLFESQRASDFFATVSYRQIRSDTTGFVEPNIHVPSDLLIRDPEAIPRRLRYYTFVSGD